MIWIAFAILAVLGIALAISWKNSGRSDAAGNALERAYLVISTLVLLGVVLPVLLGWWLDSWLLMSAPLLLIAVPIVRRLWSGLRTLVRRCAMRLRSRLPTAALRRLEWEVSAGWMEAVEERLKVTSVRDPIIGRELVRAALNGCAPDQTLPSLLAAGADASEPAALLLAAERAPDLLPVLVRYGADPTTRLPSGDPLVFLALDLGDMRLLERLIKAGASPTAVDRDGWPLVLAHASGRRGFGPGNWYGVARLIALGADPAVTGPDGKSLGAWFRETSSHTIHPDHLAFLIAQFAER